MKEDSRIIRANGAYPFLACSQKDIESFRRQTMIYDLIGIKDMNIIKTQLELLMEWDNNSCLSL
ncbi:MAG: hypothetical protein ACJ712_10555 [Nitrososphaeraceae archaeon]